MAKVYFGFAVADGMFPATCNVTRQPLTEVEVVNILAVSGNTVFDNMDVELYSRLDNGCPIVILAEGMSSVRIDEPVISCCNGSHEATVDAMHQRYGFDVSIPETPIKVELQSGDSIIIMSVRGLARLTESRHYSEEEVAKATFVFGLWTVA